MYQNFIGIDIGKTEFVVAQHLNREIAAFPNNLEGFKLFISKYSAILDSTLCVLETTGGYELGLLRYLRSKQISVHRANTRKVKHFIRSFGTLGKSDAIDAKGLAAYGAERHAILDIFDENPYKALQKLISRRNDLKQMLVQEKNRLKAPDQAELNHSFNAVIQVLEDQLNKIKEDVELFCSQVFEINQAREVIEVIPGIGKIISAELISLLPELGKLNRKKIASLAGVAPHPYESGSKIGCRPTRGGRENVKRVLFMAAMTATRSSSKLGDFYKNLVARNKKKMVALVALMRKILITANAKLRDFYNSQSLSQHG